MTAVIIEKVILWIFLGPQHSYGQLLVWVLAASMLPITGPLCPHGRLQSWSPKSIRGLHRSHPYSAAQRGAAQRKGGRLRVSVYERYPTPNIRESVMTCHQFAPANVLHWTWEVEVPHYTGSLVRLSGLNCVQESSQLINNHWIPRKIYRMSHRCFQLCSMYISCYVCAVQSLLCCWAEL